jgi:hypothetical protein
MTDNSKIPGHAARLKRYESFRILDDLRIRYYGKLRLAKTPGRSVGNRVVTELNTRTWMETLDIQGRPTVIRPKYGSKPHYVMDPETGKFTGETF